MSCDGEAHSFSDGRPFNGLELSFRAGLGFARMRYEYWGA